MVVSGRCKVVHIEFLQIIAILEGTIMYNHLQHCVGVLHARYCILEHYLLDVFVATQGGAVYGNGLVVVGSTYVVVEAHLAIFLVQFFVVDAYDLHIPGLTAVACGSEQLIEAEIAVNGFQRLE